MLRLVSFFLSVLLLFPAIEGLDGNASLVASSRDYGSGYSYFGGLGGGGHSFFDIALTALAFMSFGIFLLNLLMNALFLTTTQGLTSTGAIITTTGTGTGTGGTSTGGTGTGGALIFIRKKRAVLELNVDNLTAANVLCATVLKSIDAMTQKHECVPKVYCEGNRQAQIIGNSNIDAKGIQYVMPFFSIVTSYVGEKWGLHRCFLPALDAIIEGASESNCEEKYSSQCY